MVSHYRVARDTAEVAVTRAVRTLAVVLPSLALVHVLTNSRDYHQPAAAVAVWLAVLGAGAWLVPRLRTGGLAAGETAAAIGIEVAAVAAIGATHRADSAPGSIDLAILGTIWLLILVVITHPARVWIPAAVGVFAVQGGMLIRDEGLNALTLSQAGAAGYIVAVALMVFAALRRTLAMQAALAARQASLASRSAAERAAADAIAQERRNRLAVLEEEALPLLRGIIDGVLDPAEPGVRQECARHAAVLRHSLTSAAPGAGALLAGLGPALRAAAARRLLVTVQTIGDPGTPGPLVARAVLVTVDAVISALPPHQVTLTVLAPGDDVELYLTFSAPPASVPDLTQFGLNLPAAVCWRARLNPAGADGGFLEVSWRKDSAA